MTKTYAVTGALGYTGKYITERLLTSESTVISLTGHPGRPNHFGDRVTTAPFNFDAPASLTRTLEGVDTLFNTYWIRFAHGDINHDTAVDNLKTLFSAAESAGVRRIVHVSITNASVNSSLPYFRGKALIEQALHQSSISHAILRPTVIFGREDILINNIAWLLRKFPFHPIFGDGEYRVQPIFVEDLADLAVEMGQRSDNVAVDAVGPEVYTYREMVILIADKIGVRSRLVAVNPSLALLASRFMGIFLKDVVLTRDEIDGLMGDLLVSKSGEPPPGSSLLPEWLGENAHLLGKGYSSELDRHYR
jgi:NADH dehydrogenase